MEHIDITIDLETCSLKPSAAIMQIAAVAWDRTVVPGGGKLPFLSPDPGNTLCDFNVANNVLLEFNAGVDLRDCFMKGMDIDADTEAFWAKQKEKVKDAVRGLESNFLCNALTRFDGWIEHIKNTYGVKSVCIWAQGSDFDIPILKNAYDICGMKFPICYRNVRCARTYIMERGGENYDAVNSYLGAQNGADIYKMVPPLPANFQNDNMVHDALYDCMRTTWAVWNVMHGVDASDKA